MRSHHAPTLNLLNRFTYKDRKSRNRRGIWVYEKGRGPRPSSDLKSECAEHGYFRGAESGESESEMDFRFNSQYEIPFNRLLPAIDADLDVFESLESRQVCACFVANLFHRALATRKGGELLLTDMLDDQQSIINNPAKLLAHTAKLSALTGRSIAISDVKDGLLKNVARYSKTEEKRALYVNNIDRATKALSSHLTMMNWSILHSDSAASFFLSDTPVISRAIDYFGNVTFGEGIGRPNTEWILPISPRKAIRVAHRSRSNPSIHTAEIDQLNLAQICNMSKRLYGREYSSWVDETVQRYAGIHKFHVDVFKGYVGVDREDEFDDIMASA